MGAVIEVPHIEGAVPRCDTQQWSAVGRMPIGLGKLVIQQCISIALSREEGNQIGEWGDCQKRKVRMSGPRHPNGSKSNGSSASCSVEQVTQTRLATQRTQVTTSRYLGTSRSDSKKTRLFFYNSKIS
jgi:hypothetical protein